MTNKPLSLELIQIATPCHASWDEMRGDDLVRFCGHCRLNVYNLSEMPRGEAEQFIADREGRTCVRYYRRHDGTVITRDCPVGVRAIRQRVVRSAVALAGLLVALIGSTAFGGLLSRWLPAWRSPSESFANWIDPHPPELFVGDIVMGGCPPPPPVIIPPVPANAIPASNEGEAQPQ
jgi:hypothetical protein